MDTDDEDEDDADSNLSKAEIAELYKKYRQTYDEDCCAMGPPVTEFLGNYASGSYWSSSPPAAPAQRPVVRKMSTVRQPKNTTDRLSQIMSQGDRPSTQPKPTCPADIDTADIRNFCVPTSKKGKDNGKNGMATSIMTMQKSLQNPYAKNKSQSGELYALGKGISVLTTGKWPGCSHPCVRSFFCFRTNI